MSKMKNEVVRPAPEENIPKEPFNVLERLFLLAGVLPPTENFTMIKIIDRLRGELSFSEAEHERYEIKQQIDGKLSVTQDLKKLEEVKMICLGKRAREVIVNGLKELDRRKKLTPGHIILYERFVVGSGDYDEET